MRARAFVFLVSCLVLAAAGLVQVQQSIPYNASVATLRKLYQPDQYRPNRSVSLRVSQSGLQDYEGESIEELLVYGATKLQKELLARDYFSSVVILAEGEKSQSHFHIDVVIGDVVGGNRVGRIVEWYGSATMAINLRRQNEIL